MTGGAAGLERHRRHWTGIDVVGVTDGVSRAFEEPTERLSKKRKVRVLVSIAAELHLQLKAAAEERGELPQTEVFLDAFAHHHQAVRESTATAR